MNNRETISVVGIKSDGTHTEVGAIPIPPTMKAREILRSYFGADVDTEGTDADMAMAAMEEFILWLKKEGRLHSTQITPAAQESAKNPITVDGDELSGALQSLQQFIQGGPKRLILQAENQIKTALANSIQSPR